MKYPVLPRLQRGPRGYSNAQIVVGPRRSCHPVVVVSRRRRRRHRRRRRRRRRRRCHVIIILIVIRRHLNRSSGELQRVLVRAKATLLSHTQLQFCKSASLWKPRLQYASQPPLVQTQWSKNRSLYLVHARHK